VGLRIVARTVDRYRVFATTTTAARTARLRAAGAVALQVDLDRPRAARRLAGLSHRVIVLAPPPAEGDDDPRTARLLVALAQAAVPRRVRIAYVSTTGVYGDRGGGRVDECTPVAPASARARRRVAAEVRMRAAGAVVLRAPGIYAHDRLPLDRLRNGLPALAPVDDVATNHIHADDLARYAWRALLVGRAGRVFNVVDDSALMMGDYFDRVADACGLPRPPRLSRAAIAARVTPAMLSFMSESRRIGNARLKRELRWPLRWPDVDSTLRSLATQGARAG
jgi:hypothetical protein